jgi:hypothetical protein
MPDFKFACPYCAVHIQCDTGYAGLQIKCPSCQGDILVPQPVAAPPPLPSTPPPPPHEVPRITPAPVLPPATKLAPSAPPPPPAAGVRLRVATPSAHAAEPAPAAAPEPVTAAPRQFISMAADLEDLPAPKASQGKRLARLVTFLVVFPVAAYFGYRGVTSLQKKFNENRAKDDDPGVIGGQVGHIGELYNVLDATEVTYQGPPGLEDDSPKGKARPPAKYLKPEAPVELPSMDKLKVLPVTFSLDVTNATIPEGRVAGVISGTNFVADTARLDISGPLHLLTLSQGTNRSPDLELLVYLRLKPGEPAEGKSWIVAKDTKTGAPAVVKKWKPNPKFAPQQKTYNSGYALKVELGKPVQDRFPGKIYLALPDEPRSVVAGQFVATIRFVSPTTKGGNQPAYSFEGE